MPPLHSTPPTPRPWHIKKCSDIAGLFLSYALTSTREIILDIWINNEIVSADVRNRIILKKSLYMNLMVKKSTGLFQKMV